MTIPITGVSIFADSIFMLMAWLFIRDRIKKSATPPTQSVKYLQSFFLHFTLFFIIMGAPHLYLYFNEAQFSAAMAWGYTIGHVFLFIALTYLGRMVTTIVPSWAKYDKTVLIIGTLLNVAVTALEVRYIVYGQQPFYDYSTHITNLNVPTFIGVIITLFVMAPFLPAGILFAISAVKNSGSKRLRAALLAAGMILVILGGPLHDTAKNWQTFLVADIFTALSCLLISAGVVYRLEQSLSLKRQAKPATAR